LPLSRRCRRPDACAGCLPSWGQLGLGALGALGRRVAPVGLFQSDHGSTMFQFYIVFSRLSAR
jgi:hypothetical protein